MKFIKKIFFVLMLIWMGVIFSMSAKPAEESSKMSGSVGFYIGKIIIKDFDEMSYEKQEKLVEGMDHAIRKTAHGVEYMILGGLCILWLYDPHKDKKRMLIAFIICVLYASSDEIHQLFVEGRAGRFTDVLIDSTGAIIGIFICRLIYGIILNRIILPKRKNNTNV